MAVVLLWTLAMLLVAAVVLLWRRGHARGALSNQPASALPPGPACTDAVLGNSLDMKAAGSLHQYLAALHKHHGPIVSFRLMKEQMFSIADPALWRDVVGLFDRPTSLFDIFKPIIGTHSIQLANGDDARSRRRTYVDPAFSHLAIKTYASVFSSAAEEMVQDLHCRLAGSVDGIDVDPKELTFTVALQGVLHAALGRALPARELAGFQAAYERSWVDMESRLDGSMPPPGSEREHRFQADLAVLNSLIEDTMAAARQRRASAASSAPAPLCFLDVMLESGVGPAQARDELATFLIGGSHTSAALLTWALVYIARYPDVQARLLQEANTALASLPAGAAPQLAHVPRLPYLTCVLQETLRHAALAPVAARVASDRPVRVGAYTLPQGTAAATKRHAPTAQQRLTGWVFQVHTLFLR